ncbi:MAG: chitosanase [Pseudonocardia sp.]|nr:chitosanase [Pseudonocardia sp.]
MIGVLVACVAVLAAALFLIPRSHGTAGSAVVPTAGAEGAPASGGGVDQVIGQMVSVFENNTPEIKYDYVKDLGDGRGFTAGRAGFCTGCGDLLTVVKSYTAQVPDNPLAKYLPTLTQLAASGDDSTDGLDGFKDAWRTAAQDPVFRQVQDQVTDQLYYAPARKIAQDNGVRSSLGLAILVDTAVQQGTDNDPDSLPSMVQKTNAKAGAPPADGTDETQWLRDFLTVRRATLENPSSADTTEAWRESVGRVDALSALLDAGNLDLKTPFTINPFGDPQTIN